MNLTDSFILKCQAGIPVFLEDICAIYPVTLREIANIGYDNFLQYLQVLTSSKPLISKDEDHELKKILSNLSDFKFFLVLTHTDKEIFQLVKQAFKFFTHENVSFSLEEEQIIIGPPEEKHLLTEENFYNFQKILKKMYFLEIDEKEIVIEDEDSVAVKKLKQKMKENRKKVAKAKMKQKQQSGDDIQFSDLIGSVAVSGCGLNILTIWDITYYAFHDQLKRMGWREQFDINNRAAMAGAKLNKSQLKYWIRSIVSDDKIN